jgi:hypothetical protein
MQAIVKWILAPRRCDIGIINAGVSVWLAAEGYGSLDSSRLQVCVEGVFSYCVGTIRGAGGNEDIAVSLFRLDDGVRVLVQHSGPAGDWDDSLMVDANPEIKRTTFDAMGLFIARELLHSLTCESRYDMVLGCPLKTYDLVYRPLETPGSAS